MPKSNDKCVCCTCGESLNISKFYKSYSGLYINSLLPICKDCFSHKFGEYAKIYKSNKIAMQRMCMLFDIYFIEDIFDKCDTNDETVIGNYFRQLNMKQNRGKTFEDSINEGTFNLSGDRKPVKNKTRIVTVDEYGNEQEGAEEVNPEDIERWGVGLQPVDYANLNNHYSYLKGANPHCDSNQEIFITDLCYAKMQQLQCVRNQDRDGFKKMGEYYNATFQKSGLKVAADTETNSDDCLGVWNARISQYTPEEYYKNKTLYRDHDNLGDYFKRLVLRPLRNLQHGTTERDTEFYVKDGDDDEFIDADTE